VRTKKPCRTVQSLGGKTDGMNDRYLYRGINEKLYETSKGVLYPKLNCPFNYIFKADYTIKGDGSATAGPSEKNAVLRHELRQEGFPTSGISTTPVFERAQYYATNGGKYSIGYVFKIDRNLFRKFGVKEYIVSEWIPHPSIPEDKEIILVAQDFGSLPIEVIVDTMKASV
jgi:hypothetical protein